MPGGHPCRGFGKWLELGYAVQKGERAIRIWAPMSPSKKAIERWREEGADPGKKPRIRFRLAAVFDTLSRVCGNAVGGRASSRGEGGCSQLDDGSRGCPEARRGAVVERVHGLSSGIS